MRQETSTRDGDGASVCWLVLKNPEERIGELLAACVGEMDEHFIESVEDHQCSLSDGSAKILGCGFGSSGLGMPSALHAFAQDVVEQRHTIAMRYRARRVDERFAQSGHFLEVEIQRSESGGALLPPLFERSREALADDGLSHSVLTEDGEVGSPFRIVDPLEQGIERRSGVAQVWLLRLERNLQGVSVE